MKEKIIGIIPARLASTRLERKLLQDICGKSVLQRTYESVSYTHLRAHETVLDLVCRLLLEKKKKKHRERIFFLLEQITSYDKKI